ncbi:MAG: hypothetical protein WA160_16495 [Pseudobdellovibrio sp.]
MKDIFNDAAWKKTFQLIEEKYGKTLQFRSLKLMNNQSKSAYQHGDDYIIPMSLKNFDLGDIVVSRGSFLDEQQKTEVVDLIKFLVEPQIYNHHLKTSEQNILNQKNAAAFEKSKVVNLFPEFTDSKKTLSKVIHLKAQNEQTRTKVALKIHELSGRNLFVRLSDVISTMTCVDDLLSLSDTTILIEDIETISSSMMQILESFLSKSSDTDQDSGPLLLVGSNLTLEALEEKPWHKDLKDDLMGFYFDIDRVPIAQQTSKEILELLFFQFEGSMS